MEKGARYYQSLFGRTSEFGIEVTLIDERGASAEPGRFEYAGWGQLRLWVQGQNLCLSTASPGEEADYIEWNIGSILGWIQRSWMPLFYEDSIPAGGLGPTGVDIVAGGDRLRFPYSAPDARQLATGQGVYEWWSRHALQSCAEGGDLPNVVFRRASDDFEISWEGPTLGTNGRSFNIPRGSHTLPVENAYVVLSTFLSQSVAALQKQYPADLEVQSLVDGVRTLPSTKNPELAYEWLAGLRSKKDGHSMLDELGGQILDAVVDTEAAAAEGDILHHTPATLLFRSTSPHLTAEDIVGLKKLLDQTVGLPSTSEEFRVLAHREPLDPSRKPWESGYELAAELRKSMDVPLTEGFDSSKVLERLGIVLKHIELSDPGLRALSVKTPSRSACIAINSSSPYAGVAHAREMDIGHELCHVLFDEGYERPMAVISGPWAPLALEQRANAFAAYLKLPRDAIRAVLRRDPPSPVTQDEVRLLMKKYGVGMTTAVMNLHNLRWISAYEAEMLLGGASPLNFTDW